MPQGGTPTEVKQATEYQTAWYTRAGSLPQQVQLRVTTVPVRGQGDVTICIAPDGLEARPDKEFFATEEAACKKARTEAALYVAGAHMRMLAAQKDFDAADARLTVLVREHYERGDRR